MVVVAFPMTTSAESALFPMATSTPLTNYQNQAPASDQLTDERNIVSGSWSLSLEAPAKRQRLIESRSIQTSLALPHKVSVPNPSCSKIFSILSQNGYIQGLIAAAAFEDSDILKNLLSELNVAESFKNDSKNSNPFSKLETERLMANCEQTLIYSAISSLERSANELVASGVNATHLFQKLIAREFQKASGPLVAARTLMNIPGIDFNVRNNKGMSALMQASRLGDIEFVRFLLSRPEIDVNAQHPGSGFTALHFACFDRVQNHEDIVRLLLDHPNIDVNLPAVHGATPLIISIQNLASLSLISVLLKAPGIYTNNYNGSGPLVIAAALNMSEVVSLLIDEASGLDVNQISELHDGNSALHYAVSLEAPEMLKKLLSVREINVNILNSDGETPLMKAAECESNNGGNFAKCRDILKSLLEFNGTLINIRDNDGETALYRAVATQYLDTIKIILAYGADVNIPDLDGHTPIMMASEELSRAQAQLVMAPEERDLIEYFIQHQHQIIELLNEYGANDDSLEMLRHVLND